MFGGLWYIFDMDEKMFFESYVDVANDLVTPDLVEEWRLENRDLHVRPGFCRSLIFGVFNGLLHGILRGRCCIWVFSIP